MRNVNNVKILSKQTARCKNGWVYLTIFTTFVLFGFTFSSCKGCHSEENPAKRAGTTPAEKPQLTLEEVQTLLDNAAKTFFAAEKAAGSLLRTARLDEQAHAAANEVAQEVVALEAMESRGGSAKVLELLRITRLVVVYNQLLAKMATTMVAQGKTKTGGMVPITDMPMIKVLYKAETATMKSAWQSAGETDRDAALAAINAPRVAAGFYKPPLTHDMLEWK
jgi:hypothetical protein